MSRIGNAKRSVGLLTALLSLAALAACDSGGGGTSDSAAATSDTTADTTGTSSSSDTSDTTASSVSLLGSWTADAGAILAANTSNTGGTAGLVCTGPIVMTFNSDGTFDRSGDVSCTFGGVEGEGSINSVGKWETDGTSLVISETATSGTMTISGIEAPLPDSFGDGTADYTIADDTLTITFTIDSVGTVTQIYTRA